jgi:hypothetical protein
MSKKARRNKKSRRNRWILASVVVIFIVLVSVLAYIRSPHENSRPPLKDSSTYFAISDLWGLYRAGASNATSQNPGAAILIYQFEFTFTPVGGNATNVRIFGSGFLDPLNNNWEGTTIANGTSTDSGTMTPQWPLRSIRQSDGTYTLTIRIAAEEADGNIILHFTPEDNLFPGA